ncbi:MAG: hypothetical protein HQ488_02130 [Parcubacteria group bacterium]|nr:hypothetical protein [Parcubacteria group bacterium]
MSLIDLHRERDTQLKCLAREGKFADALTLQQEHPLPPLTLSYLVKQLPEEQQPCIIPFRGRVLLVSTCGQEALLAWDHGHQSHDAAVYRIAQQNAQIRGEQQKINWRAIKGLRLKIFPKKRFDLSDVDRSDREELHFLAEHHSISHVVYGRTTEELPVRFWGDNKLSTADSAFPRGSSGTLTPQRRKLNRERWRWSLHCWTQLQFIRANRQVEEL